MFPIVEVPESIQEGMLPYRSVFCRQEGFESVSRFVTGLIISPNKTLQGIYDLQNWGREAGPSRRSMHEAVFEAHWESLLQQVAAPASKSEKFEFAKGQITFGQRLRVVTREIFGALLQRAQQLFAQGKSCKEVLEALMPT